MNGEDTKPGSNPNIHSSSAETRERVYERAREGGVTRDNARRIADEVARTVHHNRRDR